MLNGLHFQHYVRLNLRLQMSLRNLVIRTWIVNRYPAFKQTSRICERRSETAHHHTLFGEVPQTMSWTQGDF